LSDRDFAPMRWLVFRMPTRARLLVLLATLAGLLALPAAAGALTIGIADNKPDMFSDARFERAGVRHARIAVGWDALSSPWQAEQIDEWLRAARDDNVTPLVSFGHSRTDRRRVPTPERLLFEFRRFRARYPWVTTFATWNEANHCGEPLCHRPQLAAAYYRALRSECPSCTIVAPELLDMPNMRSWVRDFQRKLGYQPKIWGLHNYVEANRFRTRRLGQLLRAAPRSRIWLTETGGLVRRDNGSRTEIPEGPRHAAEVTRFIFDRILPRNPRIARVYLYHWNSLSPADSWDSALITPGGRERSALFVLSRVLRFGLRPDVGYRSQARS
jgi:hypothetical protein